MKNHMQYDDNEFNEFNNKQWVLKTMNNNAK